MSDDNDEIYYIEFFLNGVIRLTAKDKHLKVKKIQKLMHDIVNDHGLELVKSENSMTVISEAEVIQSMMQDDESELN